MNKILKKFTHYFLVFAVLGYIVYEELIWERLAQPIVRTIQSLKLLRKLEAQLKRIHGGFILLVFVSLFVMVELQGVYAGVMFFEGKFILWLLIYAGKIPVAAFTFWLFRVTKPKLMAFAWFKTMFDALMRGIDWLKSTEIYINIKIKSAEIKTYIKKNYFRENDTTKKRIRRLYARLKIRVKAIFDRKII